MSVAEKEVIIEFNRMLVRHTGVLWEVAAGTTLLELLVVAYVVTTKQSQAPATPPHFWLILVMSISILFNISSLVVGYFGNAALMKALQDYATGNPPSWRPSSTAENMNFVQMLFLTLGLIAFFVAFLLFGGLLSAALLGVKGLATSGCSG